MAAAQVSKAKTSAANTVSWLKSFCRLSVGAAMELMSVARHLHQLPAVESAAEQGQIGFQQAAVIADSAERVGSESLLERQQELVAKAEADLDKARREHEGRAETLEAERADIEKRVEAEDARWEKDREKLMVVLRRAST